MNRKTYTKIRIATLNLCTYKDKEEELIELMKERRIDLIGLAERKTPWKRERKRLGRRICVNV